MAYSLNKVMLIGNCGNDPEVRALNNGESVANLRLATTEKWKDKNSNQMQEKTEWSNVVIFGKLAEIVEKFVKKGSKIYVEGKLVTKKWQDNNGNDRYTTEVQVNNFGGQVILLDSKGAQQPQQQTKAEPEYQNNTGFQTDFGKSGLGNPF